MTRTFETRILAVRAGVIAGTASRSFMVTSHGQLPTRHVSQRLAE